GRVTVVASTITGNHGSNGVAIATNNPNFVTLAADIITASADDAAGSRTACSPGGPPMVVDAGDNLDTDGSCISATAPATGSHGGTATYGSSTYGDVLEAYLANEAADNGGPSKTFALLNTPDPLTDLANPAFDMIPASFALPDAVDGVTTACALADQRG